MRLQSKLPSWHHLEEHYRSNIFSGFLETWLRALMNALRWLKAVFIFPSLLFPNCILASSASLLCTLTRCHTSSQSYSKCTIDPSLQFRYLDAHFIIAGVHLLFVHFIYYFFLYACEWCRLQSTRGPFLDKKKKKSNKTKQPKECKWNVTLQTWLSGMFSVSRPAKSTLNSDARSGSCSGICVVTACRLKGNVCVVTVTACPKWLLE